MKMLLYCLLGLLLTGCKEAYDSPVKSIATGYLVVEGIVNSGAGTTSITLSRTTALDKKNIVYETGAKIKLEAENSSTVYALTEKGNGVYSIDNLNLNSNIRYRLRISAKTGKEYLSDFAVVKNNPAIDSITWTRENGNGVQLYVNTHDPQNNTRFYQWTYDETWTIQSLYISVLKYKIVHGQSDVYSVVYKDSTTFSYDPTIYTCWQSFSSNTILLGSTEKLSQDVVYLPVEFIPHSSIKLGVLYSINVKQYTWTKEGYEFLDKMRKNTEATGSIFDAQPSEIKGNIHCTTDSTEPVIGYFNMCPIQEKRIFISASQAVPWGYSQGCSDIEIGNNTKDIMMNGLGLMPTTISVQAASGAIVSFLASTPECVDCTLRGTNKKPAFWP